MPADNALTFEQKSRINRRMIDALSLRLKDKESDNIDWPGEIYNDFTPSEMSLAGTVGLAPDADFQGPQAPNSMGMVLLVEPSKNNTLEVVVGGQFDLCQRYIPDLGVQIAQLKKVEGEVKDTQSLVLSYRRVTVPFSQVSITINLNSEANTWVRPSPGNPLAAALQQFAGQCLDDPRSFKVPFRLDSGGARFVFNWPEGGEGAVADQDAFNRIVARDLFERSDDVMRHDVRLRARARKAPASLTAVANAYLLEIYLENMTDRDTARAFGLDANASLLDTRFEAQLVAGTGHLLPHKLAPHDYRYKENDGVPGYGVTTSVELRGPNHYATDAIPVSALPRITNPSPASLGMDAGPQFGLLAKEPIEPLQGLVKAMDAYLRDWQALIDDMASSGQEEESRVAAAERALMVKEKEAIADGIALLEAHPPLNQAFRWMNEAMLGAFAQQKRDITEWRLFQIGFILTQVRAVYERCCSEAELTEHLNTAEVLWFATGGGKTEAYLGIILMAMFYERMNGRRYGVTAWMKFPLRMLSVQQFQRLSYVVAQANRVKVREKATLPGHPFTIGYFTGGGTPSSVTQDYQGSNRSFLPRLTAEDRKSLRFISDCPYCDAQNSVEVVADIPAARLKHVCTNRDCWSNCEMPVGEYGEGTLGELGIYVSDEEVYRYIPTVLVGTIDRLSVIGHNKRFKALLGASPYFCPDHGFTFETKCQHAIIRRDDSGELVSERCPNNSRTSKTRVMAAPDSRKAGVSFILQDELHLLKENTGNFDAHYESLMQALQRSFGCRESKVLAATATIKGFEDHIHHLYQKHARRFPSPGMKQGESFYSRAERNAAGEPLVQRWYAGILPVGTGRVMQRASALSSAQFLSLVDDWRAALNATPATVCDYVGIDAGQAPEMLAYLESYLNTCLIYSNSINDNTEIHRALSEYQQGLPIERHWGQLDGQSTLEEIQDMIRRIESKGPDDPHRQLVATSVVSHGVDIHQLNFMVMAGWPKSISEYLQASARAGRVEPGIVLAVMNSKALFHTSVFLDFQDYHRFMDRMVESVPVNRFAPNLLERTMPGMAAAVALNWATQQPWGGEDVIKKAGTLRDALRDPATGALDGFRARLLEALRVPEHAQAFFDARVVRSYERQLDLEIEKVLYGLSSVSSELSTEPVVPALARILGNRPMQSLRDIESQIRVLPNHGASEDLFEALGKR